MEAQELFSAVRMEKVGEVSGAEAGTVSVVTPGWVYRSRRGAGGSSPDLYFFAQPF